MVHSYLQYSDMKSSHKLKTTVIFCISKLLQLPYICHNVGSLLSLRYVTLTLSFTWIYTLHSSYHLNFAHSKHLYEVIRPKRLHQRLNVLSPITKGCFPLLPRLIWCLQSWPDSIVASAMGSFWASNHEHWRCEQASSLDNDTMTSANRWDSFSISITSVVSFQKMQVFKRFE